MKNYINVGLFTDLVGVGNSGSALFQLSDPQLGLEGFRAGRRSTIPSLKLKGRINYEN